MPLKCLEVIQETVTLRPNQSNYAAAWQLIDALDTQALSTMLRQLSCLMKAKTSDKVAPMLNLATLFAAGDVLLKLDCLSVMKTIPDELVIQDMFTNLQIGGMDKVRPSDEEILSQHGHIPVEIMGEKKSLADLALVSHSKLLRYFLQEL